MCSRLVPDARVYEFLRKTRCEQIQYVCRQIIIQLIPPDAKFNVKIKQTIINRS